MTRHGLLLVGVALLSLLAGVAAYHLLQPPITPALEIPVTAEFELHSIPLVDLDGRLSVVEDWRGDGLIVNFWAPWCAPCRREIPALLEIERQYAARGVRVLGLAFDGEQPVRRFAEEYAIGYPLFLVAERGPMYNAAFGNPSGSLPFTALLDRDLKIRFRHSGELTAEQLRTQLDAIL